MILAKKSVVHCPFKFICEMSCLSELKKIPDPFYILFYILCLQLYIIVYILVLLYFSLARGSDSEPCLLLWYIRDRIFIPNKYKNLDKIVGSQYLFQIILSNKNVLDLVNLKKSWNTTRTIFTNFSGEYF